MWIPLLSLSGRLKGVPSERRIGGEGGRGRGGGGDYQLKGFPPAVREWEGDPRFPGDLNVARRDRQQRTAVPTERAKYLCSKISGWC